MYQDEMTVFLWVEFGILVITYSISPGFGPVGMA